MTKSRKEKRLDVFLIPGEYNPVEQKPKDPRIIMGESDLKSLSAQKPGIQYVPKRWLEHENFQYVIPHLVLRGNILGIIIPSEELTSIQSIREKIVLIGGLPASCFRHSRYPELIEASRKLDEARENLQMAYANLKNQLELAEKKENAL